MDKVIRNISKARIINERIKLSKKNLYLCYSDSCRLITSGNALGFKAAYFNENGEFLPCYSSNCVLSQKGIYGKKIKHNILNNFSEQYFGCGESLFSIQK